MIKRYKHLADGIPKEISDHLMIESENGEWVKWEDVKKQLDDMIDKLDFHGINHRWWI